MKAIAQGLALVLLSPLARLLVMLCAVRGRYWWPLVTPDDPVSPFGAYEMTVRKVYQRFGRYAGDVYWLAWRNVLYGLAYWWGLRYRLEAAGLVQYTINLRLFAVLVGTRLDPIYWSEPGRVVSELTMDGRPTFSLRRMSDVR